MRKFTKSQKLFGQVSKVIPLASQTFSKSYLQYVKGQAPLFATEAKGAYIYDVDGNRYLDMINGLLPVILGYRYPSVDKAIKSQLQKGIIFSLASTLEYDLALLLKKYIPCAEMVRFGKNGSDVTTGAIRLARAVTGRDFIAVCGYHGWHDWFIGSTTRDLGVPGSTKEMTHKFVYNDLDSLRKLLEKFPGKFAAVIMEPENYEEPKKGFLEGVKTLAHEYGAIFVFDEVITGFRWGMGGAQKYYGVTPDLACFGKSMANGMPISALVGKKEYMEKINDIFYSFTNGGEALSLSSAIATIKELASKKVHPYLFKVGLLLKDGTNNLLAKYGLSSFIKVKGKPVWQIFSISEQAGFSDLEIKSFLQQEILQAGILWYGQHNMSFAHTVKDIKYILTAYERIFADLKNHIDKGTLRQAIKGGLITNVFKVR